jgi:hypothetical protein
MGQIVAIQSKLKLELQQHDAGSCLRRTRFRGQAALPQIIKKLPISQLSPVRGLEIGRIVSRRLNFDLFTVARDQTRGEKRL